MNNNITILYNSGGSIHEYKGYYFIFNNNSYEILTKERMTEIYNAYKNMNVINRSYLSFIIMDILGKKNDYIETKKLTLDDFYNKDEVKNVKNQMDIQIKLKEV